MALEAKPELFHGLYSCPHEPSPACESHGPCNNNPPVYDTWPEYRYHEQLLFMGRLVGLKLRKFFLSKKEQP